MSAREEMKERLMQALSFTEKEAETFVEKVAFGERDECWPWIGALGSTGYGNFRHRRLTRAAHRVVARCTEEGIGLDTCHSCDNRPCVNPNHLSFGTRSKNIKDAYARGRKTNGKRKLTKRDASAIVVMRKYQIPEQVVARVFGISQPHVNNIAAGRLWKSAHAASV